MEIYQKNRELGWFFACSPTGSVIVQGEKNAKMLSEGGKFTSRSGSYLTRELLIENCKILSEPCCECGDIVSANWTSETEKLVKEKNICFNCLHWLKLYESTNPNSVRVNGHHYIIRPKDNSSFQGFGGRTFKIEFFDGRIAETKNLWHQGEISKTWTDRMPDNAKFV
jgi:hypothetical protein